MMIMLILHPLPSSCKASCCNFTFSTSWMLLFSRDNFSVIKIHCLVANMITLSNLSQGKSVCELPFLSCCCSSCSLCSFSFADLSAFCRENSNWTTFVWCFSNFSLNSFCAPSSRDLDLSRSVSAAASLSLRGCTVPRTSCRCFASRRMSLSCSLAHWVTSPAVMCPTSTASPTAAERGCRDEGRPSLWNNSAKASPVFLRRDWTWWQASQGIREDVVVWQPTLRWSALE